VQLSARIAAQLAHPRGLPGRLLGWAMEIANERPVGLAIDELAPQDDEHILDAGCGTGAALAAVRARSECKLYGIDRSTAMIAAARRRLGHEAELAAEDVKDMADRWPPFDGVLALNVLYFADVSGAMAAALHGSLRDGGRLIVYVTHRETMERWRFARSGAHRLYDARELEETLLNGGFQRALISIEEHRVAPNVRGLIARAVRCGDGFAGLG